MTLPRRTVNKSKPPKRIKCPAHLNFVRKHHCCVPNCNRMPIEAAHVRSGLPNGEQAGMSMKPGDQWTISLCTDHHGEQHNMGEYSFENKHNICMIELAEEFASKSPHRMKLRAP